MSNISIHIRCIPTLKTRFVPFFLQLALPRAYLSLSPLPLLTYIISYSHLGNTRGGEVSNSFFLSCCVFESEKQELGGRQGGRGKGSYE